MEDQPEQTCTMMPDSIVTAIGGGNRDRNHLAMDSSQLAGSVHGRLINPEMYLENVGSQTVDFKNIGQIARLLALLRRNAFEVAFGIGIVNGSDPCHALAPATL